MNEAPIQHSRRVNSNWLETVPLCVPAAACETSLLIAIADELATMFGGIPGEYLLRARHLLTESFRRVGD